MPHRFEVQDRVMCRGQKGTIIGVVAYPDQKDPSIIREEYQVALDSAGGSGATTSFAETEVEAEDADD